MRALTVRQPWAWAIVHGGKVVENRTRNLAGSYRGPVAIHAGLAPDPAAQGHWPLGDLIPSVAWTIRGAFVGVVDLVDVHWSGMECSRGMVTCHEYELCSQWAQAYHHHLVLANPRPLPKPIPARGQLGLWTPSADLAEQLQAVTS